MVGLVDHWGVALDLSDLNDVDAATAITCQALLRDDESGPERVFVSRPNRVEIGHVVGEDIEPGATELSSCCAYVDGVEGSHVHCPRTAVRRRPTL